ncbi:MAG TPA: TM0106 family RecB-like putative nuclease [Propionibacteriaceae bacterium]|nr:TM0106 family RecB-like putative nuclease [Propionibacteriaceae bacterium]
MTETPTITAPPETILLGAYAARSCPVKTQNAFNPLVAIDTTNTEAEAHEGQANEGLPELFDGGAQFEEAVLEQLITSCTGRVVDLRPLSANTRDVQIEACVRAMTSGAQVIIAGCLPVDVGGHRVGVPDLLIRGADTANGSPAYHPVEVKWHRILLKPRPQEGAEEPHTLRYSTLTDPSPGTAAEISGYSLRTGSREGDFLQLAHYYRMLEACGFGAEEALAGVIGTDDLFDGPVVVWTDLGDPQVRTFSRSSPEGWRLRSFLERYEHEHTFRIKIAEVARQQTGRPEQDPGLLVRPIVNRECPRCQWWEHCLPQLDPDDVSLRLDRAPLDMREIATLRRHGITTITDLADADLDQLLEWYLPEVTHREGAEGRIMVAARRARMLLEGISFDRETTGPIEMPQAEVEIDLDIESSVDGRIYLWGFLIQHAGSDGAVYQEFSRFDDLDDRSEAALAIDAFSWLRSIVDATPSVAVFHYSGYEVAKIIELARREHDELLDWAAAYAEEHFVDLLEIVKAHYFGVSGLGLKLMARHVGFSWRDEDPGGLNSQLWFAEAVHGETAEIRAQAQRRVLEYNEDDVTATSQVRAWLRVQ